MKSIYSLILSIALLLTITATVGATNPQDSIPPVQMKYVESFDKAIEISEKTKKPIFINCYAAWALPCVGMDQVVFNNKPFAQWMDKHFVNLWIDMVNSEEGKKIAEKYNINTFAQYLVIDAKGNIIHRIIGGEPLPKFQQSVSKALSQKTSLQGMNKIYAEGGKKSKDPTFIREYLKVIYKAGERDKYEKIINQYLKNIPQTDWYKKENWELVAREMKTVNSPMFLELEKNKEKFLKHNPDSIIAHRLDAMFSMEFFYTAIGREEPYDQEKEEILYQRAKKAGVLSDSQAFVFYEVGKLKHEKKYTELVQLLEKNTPLIDERYAEMIDYSLATIPNLNKKEKEIIKNYITQKVQNPRYQDRTVYKNILKKFNQQDGINFSKLQFAEALEKAKQTEQLLFIDAYTSWCGPCKMMANDVFTQSEVGKIFNEKFINLKIDMEKGEGKVLAQKYNVTAYPTFLLVDHNGHLVHKVIGAMDKTTFIKTILRGTNPNTSYQGMKMKYPLWKTDKNFMISYCLTLAAAGESIHTTSDNPSRFSPTDVVEVLSPLDVSERTHPDAWLLFNNYLQGSLKEPIIRDFIENIPIFEQKIGKEPVAKKTNDLLFPIIAKELREKSTQKDWEAFRKNTLTKIPKDYSVRLLYRIMDAYRLEKLEKIIQLYNDEVKTIPVLEDRIMFDNLLYYIFDKTTDKAQQKAVISYIESCQNDAPAYYKNLLDNIKQQFNI